MNEIFRQLVASQGLQTERCLYIDDLPANIAAGRTWGFQTHTYDFRTHADFESRLANWLKVLG